MTFLHTFGHKPLAGYTIKRGVSKGGFGEVYFGLSDGGKEVALKRIVCHHDIELRGIRHCLNLKHPHLVHLYDLKTDERGDHWLVMEFVRGETLQSLLRKHPRGLPEEMVRTWFGQIAAAIHSLHEQGIVHRDLKPANVFVENGLIKVGDYGLCKFVGGSQHRSQTQNVGTIHYMAPEIGKGDYSKAIDIYAAGVVLYEMVTGRVPFDGETTGEILMKHLSEAPDLTGTGAFAPILARALAKDPAQRYASLSEMAHRVADTERQAARPSLPRQEIAQPTMTVSDLTTTAIVAPDGFPRPEIASALMKAGLAAAGLSLAIAKIHDNDVLSGMPAAALAVVASWGILLFSRAWPRPAHDAVFRRLALTALGASLGVATVWLEGYSFLNPRPGVDPFETRGGWLSLTALMGHVAYFGLLFGLFRWCRLAAPSRSTRFSWAAVIAMSFWGFALSFLLPSSDDRYLGLMVAATTAAAVQLAAPIRDPAPPASKKMRLRWATMKT